MFSDLCLTSIDHPAKCQYVYTLFASTFEEIQHPMYHVLLLIITISRINPEYIACKGEDACKGSDVTLTCESGSDCKINCKGKAACMDAKIDGSSAIDVTVLCNGEDACKGSGRIICGSGDCLLRCSTSNTACEDTTIKTNNALSFKCTSDVNACDREGIPSSYSPGPTKSPTERPTKRPTNRPTDRPTNRPTNRPTKQPSNDALNVPTSDVSEQSQYAATIAVIYQTNNNESQKGDVHVSSTVLSQNAEIVPIVYMYGIVVISIVLLVVLVALVGCALMMYRNKTMKQRNDEANLAQSNSCKDEGDSQEQPIVLPSTTDVINDDRHRRSTDLSEMYVNKTDDTPRKAQKSIQREYVLIAAKGVSRCTDCSQEKHGKVYEADGQFYCNECWN
eukprot:471016_1